MSGASEDNFQKYNSADDTWEVLSPAYIGADARVQGFTMNGKAYIIFGWQGKGVPTNLFWEYDVSSDEWTENTPFPDGYRAKTGIFVLDGLAYVGTGEFGGGTTDRFYRYYPETDSWEFIEPCGYDTHASFSFALNNKGYIGLGSRFRQPTENDPTQYVAQNEVWRLDPEFLSIEEQLLQNSSIYPNPTSHQITITNLTRDIVVKVFDMHGKQVEARLQENTIDVSNLSSGIYFMKIVEGNRQQTLKFVKQ